MTVEFDDFEDWYRINYQRLVNSVSLAIGDRAIASDAAAEACVRALARWKRVRRMEHPGGWIYRVALNDARRRLGRANRERIVLSSGELGLPTASEPIEPDSEIWAAVARLPQRTREAVVLRYVADLTEPAIAEILDVRRGTVATMLRRAHERLGTELRPIPTERPGEYEHVHN